MSGDDFSDFLRLADDLSKAGEKLPGEVRKVVKKSAQNIKDATRAGVSGHPSWGSLAATVSYGLAGNAHYSAAQVGYEDRGQGELAGIAEFGSARKAPNPALVPAVAEEEPRFFDALTKAAGDALW